MPVLRVIEGSPIDVPVFLSFANINRKLLAQNPLRPFIPEAPGPALMRHFAHLVNSYTCWRKCHIIIQCVDKRSEDSLYLLKGKG